jgi:DegV family protein with EDD domain
VVDNSCDIPESMAEELGLSVVPLVVNFGQETYLDCELTREEFWRKAEEVCHPRTSQPSVGAFAERFRPLVEAGDEVICLTITGKHSGTYNSAWAAAQEFGERVTAVDSLSLSWGLGWQALAAREAAEAGQSVPQILEMLTGMRERTHIIILLDTLEYLERGGRASRVMPTIKKAVSILNIKPVLTMEDGELKLLGVARSFQRGIQRLRREAIAAGPYDKLSVIHIRRPEMAEIVAQQLAQELKHPLDEIRIAETGTVLSCQGGPGVVAAIGLRQ